ncbi:DUF3592 domain-containing protein [Kitasatospora sp. NPDC094015]|uniref:DUF3592 domain-containing protein n=1 Tax=Kitasatospora sp. NPDC094015 TaxID=3155205 RepID=UPI003317D2E7
MAGGRLVLGVLVGPVVMVVGLVGGTGYVERRADFGHGNRVEAVVTEIEYARPGPRQGVHRMTVALPGTTSDDWLEIEDPGSASDRLVPGDRAVVLVSDARPGRALFPQQLGLGALALPAVLLLSGVLLTVAGVHAWRRGDPGWRPPSAERWDP